MKKKILSRFLVVAFLSATSPAHAVLRAVGGGGGGTIGGPVTGGTNNQVLYVNSSGNLAGSANLTFNGTVLSVGSNGLNVGSGQLNVTGGNVSLSGNLTVSGTGPNSIGGATNADVQLYLQGTLTGAVTNGVALLAGTAVNVPVNGFGAIGWTAGTLNKAASGTHADFTGLRVDPPTVGAGAATITNSSALKVTGPGTGGTNNYSIWVVSGKNQFDGQVVAKGTATNDSAAAGYIGEYVSSTVATASSVALTTGTTANITSVSLTAGDWDCRGAVDYTFGATTSYTNLTGGISATSATLGAQDSGFDYETSAIVPTATADMTWVTPVSRVSLASTTTYYLVAQATFTVSTLKAYGTISCRRVR